MDERIIEIKSTISGLLLNINARIDDINNKYKNDGNLDEGRLVNLLDDLESLAEGMDFIKEYCEGINLYELSDKLDLLKEALEEQDSSLVTDILFYELKDLLVYWNTCLNN